MMTVDEFIRQYTKEAPFEITDGHLIPSMPMVAGQSYAAQNIYRVLFDYENFGEMFFRLPFVILNQNGIIRDARLTEICWVVKGRLQTYKVEMPDWGDKPLMIAPDIAINVLPYDGSMTDLNDKFDRDLLLGVQQVWVIDGNHKTVLVRTRTSQVKLMEKMIHSPAARSFPALRCL